VGADSIPLRLLFLPSVRQLRKQPFKECSGFTNTRAVVAINLYNPLGQENIQLGSHRRNLALGSLGSRIENAV
jgi:hypothetical protein